MEVTLRLDIVARAKSKMEARAVNTFQELQELGQELLDSCLTWEKFDRPGLSRVPNLASSDLAVLHTSPAEVAPIVDLEGGVKRVKASSTAWSLGTSDVDPELVQTLVDKGFSRERCVEAMQAAGGALDIAIDLLMEEDARVSTAGGSSSGSTCWPLPLPPRFPSPVEGEPHVEMEQGEDMYLEYKKGSARKTMR